jgi:hypothetical protein
MLLNVRFVMEPEYIVNAGMEEEPAYFIRKSLQSGEGPAFSTGVFRRCFVGIDSNNGI